MARRLTGGTIGGTPAATAAADSDFLRSRAFSLTCVAVVQQ